MFQAEFTHEGDKCTFEVLLDRVALNDPALRAIAEIIHDIDLRDNKFGREESVGIRTLIDGIARMTPSASREAPRCSTTFIKFSEENGSRRERPMRRSLSGSARLSWRNDFSKGQWTWTETSLQFLRMSSMDASVRPRRLLLSTCAAPPLTRRKIA
jgi:hypothetical protein